MPAKIPAHVREQKINSMPNISFVRWADGYRNNKSKAICRCAIDGYEWPVEVNSLLNGGKRCPACSQKRHWTASERERQINESPKLSFIRWEGEYDGAFTRALVRCKTDGYEWLATVDNLVNKGSGCPECSGQRRIPASEREQQINSLPNISFVRWDGEYRGANSRAICRCSAGHEWSTSASALIHRGSGCASCAEYGYDPAKPATLYFLRSECGAMVKIGISNDYKTRHAKLKRATPFNWSCIEMIHGDGVFIAELEKELHSWTQPVEFKEQFDGFTEWRKWDDRLPRWIARFRLKVEAL